MLLGWSGWQWQQARAQLDRSTRLQAVFNTLLRTPLGASEVPADPDYQPVIQEIQQLHSEHRWDAIAMRVAQAQARVVAVEQHAQRQQQNALYALFAVALIGLLGGGGTLVLYCSAEAKRQRAEAQQQELATAAQQLDDLTAYTRIGIVVLDVDGRVVQVNQAFQAITGQTQQALKANGFGACFVDDLGQRTAWAQLYHTGQRSWATEALMNRAGGKPFWASIRYIRRPEQNAGDNLMLALVEDISTEREHQQALVEAKERAEEMAQAKNSFLTNMTHELCTPIAGILGAAGLMTDEVQDEEHQEYLQLIRESGERLLATVNAVLQLAQLESRAVRLSIDQVDLVAYLRSLVRLFPPPGQKAIEVKHVWPDDPVRADVDRVFLQRIVQNLISNAYKYTEEGTVTIGVASRDGAAVIWVADTGIGIDACHQKTIFQAFTQESDGHSRSHEGVGLGLTITRLQVEYMGGTIHLKSEKGKGSRFEVVFPQKGVHRLGGSQLQALNGAA